MSYIKQKDEGVPADNIEGTIAPDQVAYGDPDNSGKIKGSNNFTFIDESGGSGPTVQLRGDKPTMTIRDDTDATDYSTTLQQSGASMYVSAIRSGAETDNQELIRMQRTEIAVNDDAENLDVRIEGQTESNLLRTDASQDNVGIGTAPASDVAALHVKADSPGFSSLVRLHVDDDGGAVGPILEMFRESASPAAGDDLGQIQFTGRDSANAKLTYFQIKGEIRDPSTGSDDGELIFIGPSNSVDVEFMRMSKTVGVVVNEGGTSVIDFRVEGDTDTNLIRTSASLDKVTVGGAPGSADAKLTVNSGSERNSLDLISTQADANGGPNLRLYRDSGSPASGDTIGQVGFYGKDDGGNDTEYARISVQVNDETGGTEDGWLRFGASYAGNMQPNLMTIRGDEPAVVVNEDSAVVDFRVESNNNANMLKVDGGQDNVGIGTAPDSGVEVLHVKGTGLTDMVVFEGTSEGSGGTDGPDLILYNSATPTGPNKFIGRLEFRGKNDAAAAKGYGSIQTFIQDETASTEDSLMLFKTFTGGAALEKCRFNLGGTELNSTGSASLNFDVKTSSSTQQSFFKTYNNSDVAERYTEVLRGSRTLTSTPVSITEDRCYGSNIVTDTGASVVNLPEAIPGMHLQVVNKNISGITIAPAATETINGSASSYSVQHGWVIAKVICVAAGEWVVAEAN